MSSIAGRVMYTVTFFVMSILAFILRVWGKEILSWVPEIQACEGESSACYGTLAVYRVSFCLAVFHALFALIMLGVSTFGDWRTTLQDGFWGLKFPLLLLSVFGSLFIPNEFFNYYGWLALAVSGLFIVIQLIYLIDFAHSWAENWIDKMEASEENGKKWFALLLGCTIVLFAISFVMTVVMYVYFCDDGVECGKNVAVVSINVALCFLLSILSIHPKIQEAMPRSGLLQGAVISAYATYLVFSANLSDDNTTCNPWKNDSSASSMTLLVGAAFTIIAVCYATFNAASNSSAEPHHETTSLTSATPDEEGGKHDNPDEPVPYSFSKFHLVFMMGAMYIAMLMTDWSTVYHPARENVTVDSGLAAYWVKSISSWICCCLYMWTLIGPVLLPDRDWS
eukprot:CAMPEP_0168565760 /NCGR_PEP_ID=MMETSP0413-20121227/14030_1 /TAXON_ID=136452 /ORGANISM="Filamoeba nolandi, Strain NC-AS-23-1" /LENGTH=394 /DNA_ID=CAMNT_0008597679 /DNA_START=109 /DNA_END=1293 /DNA_ORIENTATION=-